MDILKQLNWVDIFVIIILFRIGYIALQNGLPAELFKFLGSLSAIYLSLHYYTTLSDWIGGRFFVSREKMPLEFLDFLCFVSLASLGYIIFVALRQTFSRFIKMEAGPKLNKWGGLVLGLVRGLCLSSLIVFMLVISSISYLKNSIINSYSGVRLFKLAPATYNRLWLGLMSKFMNKEKFNQTILEVQDSLTQK